MNHELTRAIADKRQIESSTRSGSCAYWNVGLVEHGLTRGSTIEPGTRDSPASADAFRANARHRDALPKES